MIGEVLGLAAVIYMGLVAYNILIKILWHLALSFDKKRDASNMPEEVKEHLEKIEWMFFVMDMHPTAILTLRGTREHTWLFVMRLTNELGLTYISNSMAYMDMLGAYEAVLSITKEERAGLSEEAYQQTIENEANHIKEFRNMYPRTSKLLEKVCGFKAL